MVLGYRAVMQNVVEGIANLDRELLAGSAVIARPSLNPTAADRARSAAPNAAPQPACRSTSAAGRRSHDGRWDRVRSRRWCLLSETVCAAPRPSAEARARRARRRRCRVLL